MRKDITIAAEPRTTRGKNEARRLRVKERIPAVVYGTGNAPLAVSVSPKEVNRILHSSTGVNTIFNLDVPGVENTPVMVVDWQHDPVKNNLLHIDLLRIDLTKRLKVKVPLHAIGEPAGVKQQGGVFEAVLRELEIECLPDEIPESFSYDVAAFMIGDSLRASQIQLSGSMTLVTATDQVVSHVISVRISETETATAEEGAEATGDAAAEPEVIKKGKKEEEGAEAQEKEKKK
jgi:large subunit ribosomal protein L25